MEVRHGFPRVATVVDDETEALGNLIDSEAAGHFSGGEEEGSELRLVLRGCLSNARDDFFGHDQDMDRCLRRDVTEGEGLIVFVNNVRRNLAGDDFFKEGHGGGGGGGSYWLLAIGRAMAGPWAKGGRAGGFP